MTTPLIPTLCYVISPLGLSSQDQIVVRHDLGLVFSDDQLVVQLSSIVRNCVINLRHKARSKGYMHMSYSAEVVADRIADQDGVVYRVLTLKVQVPEETRR